MTNAELFFWSYVAQRHPEIWDKIGPHVPKLDIAKVLKDLTPEARKQTVKIAQEFADFSQSIVAAEVNISKKSS